jgi:hypothetical protein
MVSGSRLAIGMTCLGLLSIACGLVQSQETVKSDSRMKELQDKHLAILQTISDAAKASFMSANAAFEDVHVAQGALLAARLEYAGTREERLKISDEIIQGAEEWHKYAAKRAEGGAGTRVAALKAQASLVEAQIAKEKLLASE